VTQWTPATRYLLGRSKVMLTGIAVMPTATHDFPGAWEITVGVIFVIVLIFVRMYVGKNR